MREALRSVAAHRMIESRAGAGYFLCEQQPETMFDRMVVPSLLAEDTMRNLQEVRMVIEVAAIALASQRASEDDLLALEMTWATMASDPNYQPLALRFHELIIAAAHNPVMSSLYGVISSGIIEYIDERYQAGRTREQELELTPVLAGCYQVTRHRTSAGGDVRAPSASERRSGPPDDGSDLKARAGIDCSGPRTWARPISAGENVVGIMPTVMSSDPENQGRAYSQAVRYGDLVFTHGQTGRNPVTKELVAGGIGAETVQAIENLAAILEGNGAALKTVIKVGVYLADFADFDQFNQAYVRCFGAHRPARTVVQVAALHGGARVELDMVAGIAG